MKLLHQGTRIVATATDEYEGPETWVVAPEGFDTSKVFDYTVVDGQLVAPSLSSANKAQAVSLLVATDWSELPSVTNTANTPHLINASEFASYRNTIRAIAVSPPDATVNWPTIPTEQWSS